jgi:hypothetical protein
MKTFCRTTHSEMTFIRAIYTQENTQYKGGLADWHIIKTSSRTTHSIMTHSKTAHSKMTFSITLRLHIVATIKTLGIDTQH